MQVNSSSSRHGTSVLHRKFILLLFNSGLEAFSFTVPLKYTAFSIINPQYTTYMEIHNKIHKAQYTNTTDNSSLEYKLQKKNGYSSGLLLASKDLRSGMIWISVDNVFQSWESFMELRGWLSKCRSKMLVFYSCHTYSVTVLFLGTSGKTLWVNTFEN